MSDPLTVTNVSGLDININSDQVLRPFWNWSSITLENESPELNSDFDSRLIHKLYNASSSNCSRFNDIP